MSSHILDDLIRLIDRDNFSAEAHGAGHRIVIAERAATLHKPSLMRSLAPWSGRGERHVFVKRWSVPKEVRDWRFQWTEGATAISLDFDAIFVVQANEDSHALGLAQCLLAESENAGEALYGLINAQLHDEVHRFLNKCESGSQSRNLLDAFNRSSNGIGESSVLNHAVSERVSRLLGGAHFRIGFQLKNMPPMQIELNCSDKFRLADSALERRAVTSALLQLDNFQAFQKSGLKTAEAVCANMESAVERVVKQFLFSHNYYDIVRSFTLGDDSIKQHMERSIQDDAKSIGYRLEMFQTFPDIAALHLLEPTRIDIPAEEKYPLFKSTGFVQISLALSVKATGDFSRLHLLIEPDATDVAIPIAAHVRQICRDNIQRFDHRAFNLNFDDAIVPELHRTIVEGLAAFGLATEIIYIRDLPTEDAARFLALRGRTIDFKATILPQADNAEGDPVPVVGAIEITGMAENGWAQFEGKDFGFRQDSPRSEALLRTQADEIGVPLSAAMERRELAIELELAHIRDRVIGTLEGAMAMGPGLARHWTDWKSSEKISAWATDLSTAAIADEYGVTIALRAFRRLDTDTETTARTLRLARHEQLRQVASEESRAEIAHQHALRQVADANQLALLTSLGRTDKLALDDMDPEMIERVRRDAERIEQARRSVGSEAKALMPPPAERRTTSAELPWNQPAKSDSASGRVDPASPATD